MFCFLAPYPSALLPSGPALSSEHVPTSSQVSLLPSLSQTISFAILNSDLPISTTSHMPASPHSTRRTRQSKRSTYILPHTLLHLLLSLLHRRQSCSLFSRSELPNLLPFKNSWRHSKLSNHDPKNTAHLHPPSNLSAPVPFPLSDRRHPSSSYTPSSQHTQ